MTNTINLNPVLIDSWADDLKGPVALHLRQKLVPVEGEGGIIFPPTYADIGYNVDTLQDGSKVAMIDSVGSQANRLEPIFKNEPYADLVPQLEIEMRVSEDDGEKYTEVRSILDLAHRGADAVVYSCPTLAPEMEKAFRALERHGDAGPICRLAPTSLLFGVWDSRGGSGQKRPRLVRSIIRAWDVQPIYSAAQFNSVWKALDSEQQAELTDEAKARKIELSERGFADAPATFRKISERASKHMQKFKDGLPNPERRVLGGVIATGPIERDITINLVALRGVKGDSDDKTRKIRRYLLGLALVVATADIELFLREGCHLRYADDDRWEIVPRRGDVDFIVLSTAAVQAEILGYARAASAPFKKEWPAVLRHKFDLNAAKKLLAKKDTDEESET